jgi:hypothetical protein
MAERLWAMKTHRVDITVQMMPYDQGQTMRHGTTCTTDFIPAK